MTKKILLIIPLLLMLFITLAHAVTYTDTVGGTSGGGNTGSAGYIYASEVTASHSGTLQTLGSNFNQGGGTFTVALYSNNAGAPGTLLANTVVNSVETGGFDNLAVVQSSVSIVSGTIYWIAVQWSSNSAGGYESTPCSVCKYTSGYGSYPVFPSGSTIGASANNQQNVQMTYGIIPTPFTTKVTFVCPPNEQPTINASTANTYYNSNSTPLMIYASTNGASIGSYASTYNSADNVIYPGNIAVNQTGSSAAASSSSMIIPGTDYFNYSYIGTYNYFRCQWLPSGSSSSYTGTNGIFVSGTTIGVVAGTGISNTLGTVSNTNVSASKITGTSPITVTSYTVGCSSCFTGSTINYQFVAPIITEPVATGTENVTLGIDPASLLLYESATASPDVPNNNILGFIPYATRSTSTFTSVANNQELMSFISNKTVPSALFLPAGRVIIHQHAIQTAGTQQAELYAKVYLTTATGVPVTLLGTSVRSGVLSATETEWNLTFFSYNALYSPSITPANRIMTEIFVATAGGGTAPTIQLVYGGEADSQTDTPYFVVTGNVTYPLYHNVNGSLRFAYNHTNTFINVSGNFSVKNTIYTGTNGIYVSGTKIGAIAGTGISNTLDTISSTTSTYTAGTGLGLSGSQFYLLPLTGQSPITITSTNTISCSTCFTGSTVTTYTTYTTLTTIAYTGANGIDVSASGLITANTASPLTNTSYVLKCPSCFTGTTTSVTSITTTSVTTTASTTSSTSTSTSTTSVTTSTVYVPIYTASYPLTISPTNVISLLYNTSDFYLNATEYLSALTSGHGTTYTALAPLYISSGNVISLEYNNPLTLVSGALNCTGCTGRTTNAITNNTKWIVINQDQQDG